MQVIQLKGFGGPEQFQVTNIDPPKIADGQILIKVAAAGVNPVEHLIGSGSLAFLGLKPPLTLGCELAGVVEETKSSLFQKGGEVYTFISLTRNGAFAEYAVALEDEAAPKPANLSFAEAASVPVGALTAWEGLFDHGHLEAGQTVLIHGAAGAVGSMGIQLAKWKGAQAIGTASGTNLDYLRQIGADQVIDYKSDHFEDKVSGVDVVFDCVGGETQERSFPVLRKGGVLVTTTVPPSQEKASQAGASATMVNVQPSREKLLQIKELVEAGTLKTRVDRVLPFNQGLEALEIVRQGQAKGKIVIEIS